jgi:hypothetical protein
MDHETFIIWAWGGLSEPGVMFPMKQGTKR